MALARIIEVDQEKIGGILSDSVFHVVVQSLEVDTSMDAFSRLDSHFLSVSNGLGI